MFAPTPMCQRLPKPHAATRRSTDWRARYLNADRREGYAEHLRDVHDADKYAAAVGDGAERSR